MPKFAGIVLLLFLTKSACSQELNFVTTVFYNSTNCTVTVQLGLEKSRGTSTTCEGASLVSISFAMQWSPDFVLKSSSFIPAGKKLDAADSDPAFPDNGTPATNPGAVGSRTIGSESYQTFNYVRSTTLCDNVIQMDCGELAPLFIATFQLNCDDAKKYNFVYDNKSGADNSKYPIEFNDGKQAPSNTNKEILFVTSVTKSFTDVSGGCKPGGMINGSNVLTADVRSNTYINTYGAILPLSLQFFDARKKDAAVVLGWATNNELFNKGFEVQRKTGSGFTTVAFVETVAAGEYSNEQHQYAFTDYPSGYGDHYYRLKQVSSLGTVHYSDVKVVRNNLAPEIMLYPVPSKGSITVSVPVTGQYIVLLQDIAGRVTKQWVNVSGQTFLLNGLQKGIYVFSFLNNSSGERVIKKVVVE